MAEAMLLQVTPVLETLAFPVNGEGQAGSMNSMHSPPTALPSYLFYFYPSNEKDRQNRYLLYDL